MPFTSNRALLVSNGRYIERPAEDRTGLAEADISRGGSNGFRTTIGDFEVTETMMLKRGDQVPHFEVRTVQGGVFSYSTIWQRRNLLLVLLPKSSSDAGYISDLRAYESEFRSLDTECVIARDEVPWLRGPAVLLADRWGEVIHITAASESARSPAAYDLLPWLQYIENRCPECEGEAK